MTEDYILMLTVTDNHRTLLLLRGLLLIAKHHKKNEPSPNGTSIWSLS